ncbi:MAG: DNA-binding protein [Candidatus Buchananbacteria bacterium RIFCSPHIGHO2_02_FULL_56_16]|uniref:DNA-binding protein n=1 Tax=Candidatus Buchananbacteria bacterium RIFCSPHIGHO2_02_FULL_56_16 TaxID=1797542 RepID=A0A1G1YHG5_9BACT|nr:MAG: DNA-binding protein [Candidatus Buchananbacteria bacterium RIFCSPHIGHO2_02_FULL_56_16]
MTRLIIPTERIERAILLIRGYKVLLDQDLAVLYGVETRTLVQAVKRNRNRFPKDFMFHLTVEKQENLRSQIVTSSWGGRRYPPYAFTEQGVAMLSSVLNSNRAIRVNIEIMRAFVRLRRLLSSNEALARKLTAMERKYDKRFQAIFEVIRKLMIPAETEHRPIGFQTKGSSRKE